MIQMTKAGMMIPHSIRSAANCSMYDRLDLNKQLGTQRKTLRANIITVRTITVKGPTSFALRTRRCFRMLKMNNAFLI